MLYIMCCVLPHQLNRKNIRCCLIFPLADRQDWPRPLHLSDQSHKSSWTPDENTVNYPELAEIEMTQQQYPSSVQLKSKLEPSCYQADVLVCPQKNLLHPSTSYQNEELVSLVEVLWSSHNIYPKTPLMSNVSFYRKLSFMSQCVHFLESKTSPSSHLIPLIPRTLPSCTFSGQVSGESALESGMFSFRACWVM